MEKPSSVDQFIENAPQEAHPVLTELRKMIKTAFPGVEEKIGYGVPQYKYGNIRVGMSVAKKHTTLGFDYGAISDEMRSRLTEKGYRLGLQTLQIPFGQRVPAAEINEIFNQTKEAHT